VHELVKYVMVPKSINCVYEYAINCFLRLCMCIPSSYPLYGKDFKNLRISLVDVRLFHLNLSRKSKEIFRDGLF